MASAPIISWQIDGGKVETVVNFIFLGPKITADGDCSHEIKTLAPWKESYDKPRQYIKKQRHHFADQGPYSQIYGFSSSHVGIWEMDHNEGWAPTNWCFWITVLEKTPENPLDCKEIKLINPKGNQSWIFIRRTDAEAEVPILWPLEVKSWLTRKDSDAGKDQGQKEKGATEDEMIGHHHRFNGHEFEQTLGDNEGQGSPMPCNPWGQKSWTWLSEWTTTVIKWQVK